VTGASGLIGRHLGGEPLARGSLDLAGADVVFHLAAQTIVGEAFRDPLATFEANVALTWRILDAAREHGVRRVVVASSGQVYAPDAPVPTPESAPLVPDGPYQASKAAADLLARGWPGAPEVVVARFANVYGPGDRETSRLIPGTIAAVREGRAPRIRGDGSAARDFLFVDDAVAALRVLAEHGEPGEAYNVGTGEPRSVREVVDAVLRASGSEIEPVVEGGAPPGEGGRRALDPARLRALGWAPQTTLDEGLRRTWDEPARG
jgi:CDP-glucose 4,6-dehydratase